MADEPQIAIKLSFGKQQHEIIFSSGKTLKELKEHIEGLTHVPVQMQKLMFKGMLKDDHLPLSQTNLKDGGKVILMGSTPDDVIKVNTPKPAESSQSVQESVSAPQIWCEMKEHKKILEKGRPEDGILGKKNTRFEIQNGFSLHGLLNQRGSKVRLTFKTDVEQLWISTNEKTDKIQYSSIQGVASQKIIGQEEYSIMAFQLGPTENSRYFVYFVPNQFTESIKDTILGKFVFF